MTDPRGRPWPRLALCVVLFLGGCAALGFTATMSIMQGVASATSDVAKIVQPGVAVLVDAMVALLAGIVAIQIGDGKRVSAFFMALVLLAFGVLSVKSMVAYGIIERVEVTKRVEHNKSADKTAIQRTNELAAGSKERQLSWLRSEYTLARKEGRRKDMERLEARIDAATNAVPEVKSESIDQAFGDAEAESLSKDLGISTENYIKGNALAYAFFLIAAKMICFGCALALWPKRMTKAKRGKVSAPTAKAKVPVEIVAEPIVKTAAAELEGVPFAADEIAPECRSDVGGETAPFADHRMNGLQDKPSSVNESLTFKRSKNGGKSRAEGKSSSLQAEGKTKSSSELPAARLSTSHMSGKRRRGQISDSNSPTSTSGQTSSPHVKGRQVQRCADRKKGSAVDSDSSLRIAKSARPKNSTAHTNAVLEQLYPTCRDLYLAITPKLIASSCTSWEALRARSPQGSRAIKQVSRSANGTCAGYWSRGPPFHLLP